jgi:hypothetical protein
MELINVTRMPAGYTMGMKPSGRELLVVVVKGTFAFPDREEEEPKRAKEQVPLIEADTFTGEPGFSAPRHESDYAPVKHRCDVLCSGSAYAPHGEPAERVTVSLRVGSLSKSFDVVGNRTWKVGVLGGASATRPEAFASLPISYDNAYGGVDRLSDDPDRHDAFMPNPVGRGYHRRPWPKQFEGQPLPNTEESGRTVTDPEGRYRPMALGPVGRGWLPRLPLAGTYDDAWFADRFPFLPDDFQEGYYQSAPPDQQMEYPSGGEAVELVNMTPEGRTRFRLPRVSVPVEFHRKGEEPQRTDAPLDTVILEPDERRLVLLWRASIELKRNVFEVPMGVVGTMPRGWYRARELGKTYYPSLNDLVADRVS